MSEAAFDDASTVGTVPPRAKTLPGIGTTLARLRIADGKVRYWRNRPLEAADSRVTRAIIVIHGAGANARRYFDRINGILPADWPEKTIVLAPCFQGKSAAPNGEFWWDSHWREGGASGGLSSYEVVDNLVGRLRSGTFPNLKWVVIAGHSAGGQFAQRYAAFTNIDLQPAPNSALVKFVPANPSSYVYLNEYRSSGRANDWIIPRQDRSSSDGYNEWKYGLEGLDGYAAARGADWARHYLPLRKIELLAGTADVLDNHRFDSDRGAMWQGPTRFERAQIFKAFMDQFYATNNFRVTSVPGIGHHSGAIFASPQGMNALFFPD